MSERPDNAKADGLSQKELLRIIKSADAKGDTALDLSNKGLTQLPPEISQLTKLDALVLEENELAALPAEIGQLTSLTWLNLHHNQLAALPPEIGMLTNLTRLRLSDNQLTALPPEIGQLMELSGLDLHHNQLVALPHEIAQITKLTLLGLRDNYLTALPPEIGQFTKVIVLDLMDNQLVTLPPEVGHLTKLAQLFLRNNRLTALPPDIGQLTELIELNLGRNQLTAIPPEVGHLTKLARLYLRNNRVTALPREIGHLANLTVLDLRDNQLVTLPREIGQLTNLTWLDLMDNQLIALPSEIGQLTNLTQLLLGSNQLSSMPPEVCQLTGLTELYLGNNQLSVLPREIGQLTNLTELYLGKNQLTALPPEIGQLKNLTVLDLGDNHLTAVPPEIGQFTKAIVLDLMDNQLGNLPPEVGHLTKLAQLFLSNNRLTALPPDIGQLTELIELNLGKNQLTAIPPEVGHLTKLARLNLRNNRVTALPRQVGQLKNLTVLDLGDNQLTTLPPEIGQLTSLLLLDVSDNPLTEPPPEIVQQGTEAILAYLRAKAEESQPQWLSKLLIIGEGGVGKTSLLRALKGEPFNPQEATTHGIGQTVLPVLHPTKHGVTMQLNAWDFGGQQIYHATHQFFLTTRSLYLVVWNARIGFEQSKLYYWLDTIQARAPESPVLLVATCIEDRPADLPLTELRAKYPQIAGSYAVSNRVGTGIEEVRHGIALIGEKLPLMGERWPATWLRAAEAVRTKDQNSISARELRGIMAQHKVRPREQPILARWLHELGDIVYFQDDRELNEVALLRPDWVTATICRVLDSDAVAQNQGVFTRECMEALWEDLESPMREHFLRLMEKFDLSYRTLEDRDIGIIVERLAWEAPAFEGPWNRIGAIDNCKQVSIKFNFDSTVPAGLPTWFIARSNRFTTRTHWRNGALFADGPREHLALVQENVQSRAIRLSVRGPVPQNFFALLRDGLELTIARFPGLQVKRLVPCPGHNGEPCSHEFDFADLERAAKMAKPATAMQCPTSLEMVPLAELLFGIHWSSQDAVLGRLDELEEAAASRHRELMCEQKELRELVQREFLSAFRRDQENVDAQCPNIFVLSSAASSALLQTLDGPQGRSFWGEWGDRVAGASLDLQLCCQMPGAWHPAGEPYALRTAAEWLRPLAPYLKRMVSVLKYAAPFAGPALPVAGAMLGIASKELERFKANIEFTTSLVEKLQDFAESRLPKAMELIPELAGAARAEGAELRILRHLLDMLDPAKRWGDLRVIWTPEGHCLWLCQEHSATFST